MKQYTGYIGTYRSVQSNHIYRFILDAESGALTIPEPYLPVPDSKYIALRDDSVLVSTVRREQGAGLAVTNLRLPSPHVTAEALGDPGAGCHVAIAEDHVFTADFHAGTVTCYRLNGLQPIREHTIAIAPHAGCHQVLFHNDLLLIPCMELDECRLFSAVDYQPRGVIRFPKNSGPRHGIFDRAHRYLYLVSQKDNTISCFSVQGTHFSLCERLSLLDAPVSSCDEAAAIRFSPDERFLYVSVRGAEQIIVLEANGSQMQILQRIDCGGQHPRDIALSPDGHWLLSANRCSDDITCFPRDAVTGLLGPLCSRVPIHEGVSIVFDTTEKGR